MNRRGFRARMVNTTRHTNSQRAPGAQSHLSATAIKWAVTDMPSGASVLFFVHLGRFCNIRIWPKNSKFTSSKYEYITYTALTENLVKFQVLRKFKQNSYTNLHAHTIPRVRIINSIQGFRRKPVSQTLVFCHSSSGFIRSSTWHLGSAIFIAAQKCYGCIAARRDGQRTTAPPPQLEHFYFSFFGFPLWSESSRRSLK